MKIQIISITLIILSLFIFNGCFGGGSIGDFYETNSKDEYYDTAWNYLLTNESLKAKTYFYKILAENPDDIEKNEAYLGLAWSSLKNKEYEKAIEFFEKVTIPSNDYCVGYAATLLNINNQLAINLLKSIGADNIKTTLKSEHNLKYSGNSVRALLGLLYILNGDIIRAKNIFEALKTQKLYDDYLEEKVNNILDFINE